MDLGLGFHRLCGIHIVRQHAVGHDNRLSGFLGLFAGFRDDNGHLVAYDDGMQVQIRKIAKGWIQSGKSGEGFVMDIFRPACAASVALTSDC